MPVALRHHLRWIAPTLVLALAAVLRFWALGRPDSLVFDELYYVRDAISQLTHGYPTIWPDSEPDMSGDRATAFTDDASNAVHPPLGKWLIGLGILVFGPETGWGWRSAVALAGVATVGVTMRLGYLISRSSVIAWLAGLVLAIDGVHIVLTRVALLDGFLTFFIALGALLVWKDLESATWASDWRRPWLLAAGLAFGAAAAVKWSGLYPLAFFLVFITVRDLVTKLREKSPHPLIFTGSRAVSAAILTLPAAAAVYIASWAGWIINPGGHGRTPGVSWITSLANYHAEMLAWHSTLDAEHPYMAHPLTWPLAIKPTAMYETRWTEGCPWSECVSGISALPNPLITWGGVAALLLLAVIAIRRAVRGLRAGTALSPTIDETPLPRRVDPLVLVSAFVITGYLSNWLPWVATVSRPSVFQFYAVTLTPFAALALALVLGALCGVPIRARDGERSAPVFAAASLSGRRIAVAIYLAFALVIALLFFPVWSGTPIADWFWQSHMWLPAWR